MPDAHSPEPKAKGPKVKLSAIYSTNKITHYTVCLVSLHLCSCLELVYKLFTFPVLSHSVIGTCTKLIEQTWEYSFVFYDLRVLIKLALLIKYLLELTL